MFLPSSCPACGAQGPVPCPGCRASLRPAPPGEPPPGLDSAVALLLYDGVGRELVAHLKYRNARAGVGWLAEGMAGLVAGTSFDAVTWVPTTASRRRQRGFDQARLLAAAVGRRLQVPCHRLLLRRPGPPQTGRSRAERMRGPVLVPRSWISSPPRVLVVDDVATTGATLSAAAGCLRAGGATEVHAVVAARRPLRKS